MTPFSRKSLTLITGCLWLCGCGDGRELRLAGTRWLVLDSNHVTKELAYTLHAYDWDSQGLRLATSPRTSEIERSQARLYVVSHGWEQSVPLFADNRLIHERDHAVPCGDLMLRAADSILLFSYLPVDVAKPADCWGRRLGERRLEAIRLDGSPIPATISLDTPSILTELASRRDWDVSLYMSGYSVCPDNGAACIELTP